VHVVPDNVSNIYPWEEHNFSSDSEKWLKAVNDEMHSFEKNHTWELVQLLKGKRAVGCKWIFKKKEGIPRIE
ncbi:retrotransposon protein putative Ty1-copia subclass, partial [Trifolium medium]|nr:retrotransposon protein putative Ty1-copia subclass [Trifolium medium]